MTRHPSRRMSAATGLALVAGLGLGGAIGVGWASTPAPAPTEHRGLSVDAIGRLEAPTLAATTGLEGYFMQLRAISIAPGGQIARHSHATRPGLVAMVEGAWVEGRESGERTIRAEGYEGVPEDESTVHWFFNRTQEPATAIVCDLTPVAD